MPLNRLPPQGDGFVSYSVKAKRSAVTGSVLDAQARIIFDGNLPIDTPAIFNTLDATRPESSVVNPPAIVDSRIKVVWSGQDGEIGAGLSTFDVYVSENGSRYRLWLQNTTLFESEYAGVATSTYDFLTIARDNVGNAEPDSKLPDASRPLAMIGGPYQLREGIATRLNGSAKDPDGVISTFIYEWDFDYDGETFQVDAIGQTPELLLPDGPATRKIGMRVKDNTSGAVYSLVSSTEVQVSNTAPQLTVQSPTVTGFVNTLLRNSGTWRDAVSDTVVLTASLGEVIKNQDGTWSWTYRSLVARANELVTVTAMDSDGATSTTEFRINSSLNTQTFEPSLTSSTPALTNLRRVTVLADFKSEVVNFSADDLELVNATVVSLIDQGAGVYAIELDAQAVGDVSVKLLADRVVDAQGRANTASQTLAWKFVDTSNMDFGDAPSSYPTLIDQDGARHALSTLWLGAAVDAESNGVPSLNADGDDIIGPANNTDDEDGIDFHLAMLRSPSQSTITSFMATASASGLLSGWIDFNHDGDWDDAGEQVAKNVAVIAGPNWVPIVIPQGTVVGQTYARFRLSSQADLLPTGAAPDGEVEDHVVSIATTETPLDWSFSNKNVGTHALEVVGNQLTLTVDTQIFFQVIVTSIRRVAFVAANGTTELYVLATPANTLFGKLLYMSAVQPIVLQSDRLDIDLKGWAGQIRGIGRIELTNSEMQVLHSSVEFVQQLNLAAPLSIKLGGQDKLDFTGKWNYSESQVGGAATVHLFNSDPVAASIAVENFSTWQNPVRTNDVSGDGLVTARDALLLINQLNTGSKLPPQVAGQFFFADTNGDGRVTAIDALLIINEINTSVAGGEGEGTPPPPVPSPVAVYHDVFFEEYEPDIRQRGRRAQKT